MCMMFSTRCPGRSSRVDKANPIKRRKTLPGTSFYCHDNIFPARRLAASRPSPISRSLFAARTHTRTRARTRRAHIDLPVYAAHDSAFCFSPSKLLRYNVLPGYRISVPSPTAPPPARARARAPSFRRSGGGLSR